MKPTWEDDICQRFIAAFRAAYGPAHARRYRIGPANGRYRIWKQQDVKFADRSREPMVRLIERLEERAWTKENG